MSRKTNRTVVLCMTGLVLATLGGGMWWMLRPSEPVMPLTPLKPASTKQPAPPPPPAAKPEPEALVAAGETRIPSVEDSSNGENLAKITGLRGQLQVLQLETSIAEQEAKKLKLGAAPTESRRDVPIMAPPPAQMPVLSLPSLTPPISTERRQVRVVSVQGLDGKLSATIRTAAGALLTVHEGSRFGGGIASVSRTGVSIRKSGTTEHLSFE